MAWARMRKWWPGLAVVIVVFLLPLWPFLMLVRVFQGDDGKPIANTLASRQSPDGRWTATSEIVDNGLGFGQGKLYYEVHVHRPDQLILKHGAPDDTAVFYIEAQGREPRVSWRDGTQLLVEYEARNEHGAALTPGRHQSRHGAVTIDYRPLPSQSLKRAAPAQAKAADS